MCDRCADVRASLIRPFIVSSRLEFVFLFYHPIRYNFKILLSYLQVATTLVNLTEIPWPSAFQKFLQAFSFVNLNFVRLSVLFLAAWRFCLISFASFWLCADSMGQRAVCGVARLLRPTSAHCDCAGGGGAAARLHPLPHSLAAGEDTFVLFVFSVFDSHSSVRFVLASLQSRFDYDDAVDTRAARKLARNKIIKLIVFALFLMYPSVSSEVLSFFLCRDVSGTSYLLGL